jgi:Recombinase
VRLIFSRYLDLGSLSALQRGLRQQGIVTRRRTLSSGRAIGGRALTNGPLVHMLRNRMYLGEINHHDKSYPGEHAPIVDPKLFDAVQTKLTENRQTRSLRRQGSNALLMGKLFDDRGNPMTPTYAIKKRVRYRYYVSSDLHQGRTEEAGSIPRVAAEAVERIVLDAISALPPIKAIKLPARPRRQSCHVQSATPILRKQQKGLQLTSIKSSSALTRSKSTSSTVLIAPKRQSQSHGRRKPSGASAR